MTIFKGAGTAIITPFSPDFTIHYDKLDELLNEQIQEGIDAIIICGTTGESATMTEKEHLEAITFAVERVKGRVPVVAGTGSNCTATAIQLTKEAESVGADACLVMTPYYNKATQKGLVSHFTAIANSTKLPIIMYNIPSRTGVGMSADTVATLAKNVPNIAAIKESTGDIGFVCRTMNLCDGNLDLYSGNDDQIVPLLSIGGIGVISVLSNVVPKFTHDMVFNFLNGEYQKAGQMQLQAMPFVDALFSEVNPIPVKAAMNLLGKEVGSLRAPLTEIEGHNLALLKKAMTDFGLL